MLKALQRAHMAGVADAIDPRFERAPVLIKPTEPAELESALMRVLPSSPAHVGE